jgi:multidrug efflux system outer membrane protein
MATRMPFGLAWRSLKAPTAALALGASLMMPILDGGRLRAQVDGALSRERELVLSYHRAILAALADAQSALAAASRGNEQERLQEQVLAQARRALQLAQVRYREGADDLLTLLDAQRQLFQAQDQLAQVRLAKLLAAVTLFKALGGGWPGDDATGYSLPITSSTTMTSTITPRPPLGP